ncbi:MAG: DMT family transporter [Desulfomonile sp.]|nr:DMT family transporter [Desulfomonile sp.]
MTSSTRGYLSVIAAAVMWASSGTASKALFLGGVTPFQLVQIRITLACVALGAVLALFARHLLRVRLSDIFYLLVLGGVGLALVQATYLYTISKMPVAAAILIQYTSPFMVAVYSVCFWAERLSAFKALALFLSLIGCYLVVGGYNLHLLKMNLEGTLAGLASAVLFAAYSLLGERGMHRYAPWTVTFYAFLFAAVTWNIFQPPLHFIYTGYSAEQWGYMAYIATIGTLIPFGLFFVGVNHIRSTRATISSTAEPISAAFMAYVLLGETLEPLQILGGTLVIVAIVVLQLQQERSELAPEVIRSTSAND